MKLTAIIHLLLFFTITSAISRPSHYRVCATRTLINHQSVRLPFSSPELTRVPLLLYHPCRIHHHPHKKSYPLLILLQGSLLRPWNYKRLSKSLATNDFIVAIPDYTQRRFLNFASLTTQLAVIEQHVLETRRAGFKCPKNPQFPTTKLITSVLQFFSHTRTTSHLRRIRRQANLKNVIIFGHSFGGLAADLFFSPACIPFSAPINLPPATIFEDPMLAAQFPLRFLCEQYLPFSSPNVAVSGLITFDGLSPGANITVPPGKFHVAMHSPFQEVLYDSLFQGLSVQGKLARVLVRDANHFAPNNFVKQNDIQTPPCAIQRPPPEDMFTTTKKLQRRAVKSIVNTIVLSYKVFIRGRSPQRLTSLTERQDLSIARVSVL